MSRLASGICLIVILVSILISSSKVQPVKALSPTIYILPDGSIQGTLGIRTFDNVTYFFAVSIVNQSIVVQRGNVIIDGKGHTLQGPGNGTGIDLFGIENVTIRNTRINTFDYGIALYSSFNNVVAGNNITANNYGGIGLVSSSNNNIAENYIIANNSCGIVLYSSSSNIIVGNNIAASNGYDIGLDCSSNNSIYHNNLVGYNAQTSADSTSRGNVWDNGYPSGGNYWGDYTGSDHNTTQTQTKLGSDGIGDTPYVIDQMNLDRYPLAQLWTPHNIAVADVVIAVGKTSDQTLFGEKAKAWINTTLVNRGCHSQTFTLTIYANLTQIASVAVNSMTVDTFAVISYLWNSSSFAKANYIINSQVTGVQGEANTADNAFRRNLLITILGDVNGDRRVNVLDIIVVATNIGLKDGANYTPYTIGWYNSMNSDANGDGTHNVLDLILCASHLGQHWS